MYLYFPDTRRIFIDYTRIKFFGYNDTQHLILNNVFTKKKSVSLVYRTHSYDKVSISTILLTLTGET
jgi:hypothetical protein